MSLNIGVLSRTYSPTDTNRAETPNRPSGCVAGRVIGMSQNQAVLPGYAAFHLGTETSEQQAVQEAAMPHAPEPVDEDSEERPEAAEVQDGEDYE